MIASVLSGVLERSGEDDAAAVGVERPAPANENESESSNRARGGMHQALIREPLPPSTIVLPGVSARIVSWRMIVSSVKESPTDPF